MQYHKYTKMSHLTVKLMPISKIFNTQLNIYSHISKKGMLITPLITQERLKRFSKIQNGPASGQRRINHIKICQGEYFLLFFFVILFRIAFFYFDLQNFLHPRSQSKANINEILCEIKERSLPLLRAIRLYLAGKMAHNFCVKLFRILISTTEGGGLKQIKQMVRF